MKTESIEERLKAMEVKVEKEIPEQTFNALREIKRRQWITAYYSTFLFVGIIAFFRFKISDRIVIKILGMVFTFLVLLASEAVQIHHFKSLEDYRPPLRDIEKEKERKADISLLYSISLLIIFTVFASAAVLVIYWS